MRTGAVVLAAGHKSSQNMFQPMLKVGDTTAIKRILITLKQAEADPIVVITGQDGDAVEKHISKMRVICLRNENYETTQMFDSICIGLNYMEDLCDRVLILPVKVPMLLKETISCLMQSRRPAACPVYGNRRGHPVLLSRELIPEVLEYSGPYGLRSFLRDPRISPMVEEIPVEDEGIILEIESDEDCKRALGAVGKRRLPLYGKSNVYLGREEKFFGPGIAQLLQLVDHTGSLQTACSQMHMSYSKGWKIIKTAEKQLGYPVVYAQSGGATGGFTELTPKGRDFLNRFLKMEEEVEMETKRLFEKYFGEALGL